MALALTMIATTVSCDPMCDNEVLSDVASPDAQKHVVVFGRSCGATTGFSTQVSILPVGRTVSGGGNVFVVDDDHGRAPSGSSGGPVVTVRWLDAHTVQLRHDWRARVFRHEGEREGVQVRIVRDSQ